MPVVEECVKLKAMQIPYKGMFSITSGGRRFGINATPEAVCVVSGRWGQRIERVKLTFGGNAPGRFALWLKCPICGRKNHTLYLPPGGRGFACRKCLKLGYEAWKQPGQVRFAKDPGLWLVHFVKKAGRVMKRERLET